VHLVAEKPRAAHAGAERLVGEPVVIAPDDVLFHAVGQRIETGTAKPGIDVICRVREALGASWDEVLRGLGKSSGD